MYKEIVVDSFKETYTPKSMNPTSTKLSALVNNWLNQASVKRETVFLLGFGLKMTTEDVSDFLTRAWARPRWRRSSPHSWNARSSPSRPSRRA